MVNFQELVSDQNSTNHKLCFEKINKINEDVHYEYWNFMFIDHHLVKGRINKLTGVTEYHTKTILNLFK